MSKNLFEFIILISEFTFGLIFLAVTIYGMLYLPWVVFFSYLTLEHIVTVQQLYWCSLSIDDFNISYFIRLTKQPCVKVFTGEDWARNIRTWNCTSDYFAISARFSVLWLSKRPINIAQSWTEVQYIAIQEVFKQLMLIGCVFEELCQSDIHPNYLYCNNQRSITLAKNPKNYKRTR